MLISFSISGRSYSADLTRGIDISIPMQFDGLQPNSYNLPAASAKAWESDDWIGDVRRGGACNFDEVKLVPHCNGTHTECVGHISHDRISIVETLRESFLPATLITVEPERAAASPDSYRPPLEPADQVISRRSLEAALKEMHHSFISALVIRTLPNDESKLSRRYSEYSPPFFSIEAMTFIKELMVRHLLVDFPSLDRTFDDGLLTAHHIFWNVAEQSHEVNPAFHSLNSVTEFIYVPNVIPDGLYLLNLQIAPFKLDAAPSRPLLHDIVRENW